LEHNGKRHFKEALALIWVRKMEKDSQILSFTGQDTDEQK
jgi:hypothetical protein